jgi:signal transduction histidine kinase
MKVAEDIERTKEELLEELAQARLLHKLSIELIQEDGTSGLYKKIVEAAVAIMGSQYASMQMLVADEASIGKLHLLASSGFDGAAEKFWEWVNVNTGSSCGAALRAQKRVIVENFATSEFMQDKPTLPVFLNAGILSAQSTPLYSRSGKLLGMISTHWSRVHTPSSGQLSLLDILARQAADLIERTQHTEAVKRGEERLRALMTATNDVTYRMSADWSEMYYLDGRNFIQDTGWPLVNWLQKYIHPDDQEMVASVIRVAIDARTTFQLEHRVQRVDGSYGWIFSRAIPIIDERGKVLEWFGAASDVSEKYSLVETLERKVAERTIALQRSNEELLQFAHVASHDLKEPVRKITTFAMRIKHEIDDLTKEKTLIYTEKVLNSAFRMSTMIDGVLKHSGLYSLDEKMGLIDLNKVVSDILDDLEVLVQQKEASIHFEKLPSIEAIGVLMYQLLYNLINNSLKFSSPTERPVIGISAEYALVNDVDSVKIQVTDNGIGFDPNHNSMIFKTFARLHSISEYPGTGLGLSLAKKIAERHGGTIEADGKKGKGAVFIITLPLRQASIHS